MKILILKEHHDERYFDVSTQEKMDKVALHIIKDRFGEDGACNYLIEDGEGEWDEPKRPISYEDYQKVIGTSMQAYADARMAEYTDELNQFKQQQADKKRILKCIETNDVKEAQRILTKRKHYEDEGFQIVDVEEVE